MHFGLAVQLAIHWPAFLNATAESQDIGGDFFGGIDVSAFDAALEVSTSQPPRATTEPQQPQPQSSTSFSDVDFTTMELQQFDDAFNLQSGDRPSEAEALFGLDPAMQRHNLFAYAETLENQAPVPGGDPGGDPADDGGSQGDIGDNECEESPSDYNKFSDRYNRSVATTLGTRLRKRDVDDNLLGRDGKSHPTTRNLPAFMRLGFLKFTPDDEEGEGHNDYNASQELLAKTAFRKQEEWLENMYKRIQEGNGTPNGGSWIVFGKSCDESPFDTEFNDQESASWIRWQLQRLEFDKLVSPEGFERLSKVIHGRKCGTVNLLAQAARMRWGHGEANEHFHDFLIPACALQRTSASNLSAATDRVPSRLLSFTHFRDRAVPYLDFSLIPIITDRGSGCARWGREVAHLFRYCLLVAVFHAFCCGHVIGTSAGECLAEALTFLQRISNLFGYHDIFNAWMAAQVGVGIRRVTEENKISHLSEPEFKELEADTRWSDDAWQRIAKMTGLRDLLTSSAKHPLEPKQAHSDEALEQIRRFQTKMQALFGTMKVLIHIPRMDFTQICHLCTLARCKTWCTIDSWSERFGDAYSEIVSLMLPKGTTVSINRFLSWMRLLPCLSFTCLVGELGPEGWVSMYGDDDVEKMYFKDVIKAPEGLALDETAEQRKEKTTRIHGATKYLIQIPNRAFLTFSNCTLEIVDSLYRYLDRADSISSRGKGYTPVLFSVLATEVDKNPFKIYYKEMKGLMRPGSDLEWLLNLFYRSSGFSNESYWLLGWKAMRLLLGPYSQIKYKAGLPFERGQPWLTWTVAAMQYFYGISSNAALQAARRASGTPKCCTDQPFSEKVLGTPRMAPEKLAVSLQMDVLRAAGPDCQIFNLDKERMIRRLRSFTMGDKKHHLGTVCTQSAVEDLRTLHERRGGITVVGKATAKEVSGWEIDLFQRKQSAKHALISRIDPWRVYWKDYIRPQWERQQRGTEDIVLRGGETKMCKTKRFCRAYSEPSAAIGRPGSKAYIKGLGDWHTWESYFRVMTAKYHDSPAIQARCKERADELNAAGDEQEELVPPAPAVRDEDTWLGIGTLTSPLREEFVAETIRQTLPQTIASHPTANRELGPATAGRKLKEEKGAAQFITDPLKPKDKLMKLEAHTLCDEGHPGLCVSKDLAVKDDVLKICGNINTLMACGVKPEALNGRVIRLSFVASTADQPTVYKNFFSMAMVGYVRLTQPQVQMLMPFDTQSHPAEEGGDQYTFVDDGDHDIAVNTSYGFIRNLLCNLSNVSGGNLILRSCWICEISVAPVPCRWLRLQGVDIKHLKIKRIIDEAAPGVCIYPKPLSLSSRKKALLPLSDPKLDPHGAAMDEQELAKRQEQRVREYLKVFKRKLFDVASNAGNKRGRSTKKKPNASAGAAPSQRGGGEAGDRPDSGAPEEDDDTADPTDLVSDSDLEGDEAPMPWEERVCGDNGAAAGDHDEPPPRPDPRVARPLQNQARPPLRLRREKKLDVAAIRADTTAEVEAMARLFEKSEPAPGGADGHDGPGRRRRARVSADDGAQAGPGERKIGTFGPFDINLVVPGGGPNANARGISLVCKRHADTVGYRTGRARAHIDCRRNMTLQDFDDLEFQVHRLKRWACLGFRYVCKCPEIVGDSTIGDKDCCARQKHMGINKQYMRTKLAAQTEEKPSRRELDDLKASGIFEEEEDGHELDCLYADLEEAEAAPASASSASRG